MTDIKSDMIMRIKVLFFSYLIIFNIAAQSAFEADALFNRRQYEEAGKIYAQLLERHPRDPLYNYRFARCSYEMKDFDSAIKYFLAGGSRYPLRDYYLADSYFHSYRFDEALEFFNNYAKSPTANAVFLRDVEQKVRRATLAKQLMQNVQKVEIIDSIKTNKDEFIKHFSLSRETGTISHQILNVPGKGRIDLTSWVSPAQDLQYFSDTLNNSINIFRSHKNEAGWAQGSMLSGSINTSADENFPFVTADGLNMYFASNGEKSIGGYDIFVSKRHDHQSTFLPPVNLGMPFNSIYNDYMLVIDDQNRTGWFVTDRFQSEDQVVIYQFVFTGQSPSYIADASEDELRAYAKLRKFRKPVYRDPEISVAKQENEDEVEVIAEKDEKAETATDAPIQRTVEVARPVQETTQSVASRPMHFIINDQLIYTQTSQFRSQKALTAWNDLQRMTNELNGYEQRLRVIRREYDSVEERVERLRISNEISSLERAVVRMRLQIEEKEKMVRNEEIMTLINAQVQ